MAANKALSSNSATADSAFDTGSNETFHDVGVQCDTREIGCINLDWELSDNAHPKPASETTVQQTHKKARWVTSHVRHRASRDTVTSNRPLLQTLSVTLSRLHLTRGDPHLLWSRVSGDGAAVTSFTY